MSVISGEKIRKRLRFYGRVQGVGFRYRAYYAARGCGVSGTVRNLSDGSVLLEAQGYEEDIDRMILQIEKGTYISIENFSAETIPLEDESGFYIID